MTILRENKAYTLSIDGSRVHIELSSRDRTKVFLDVLEDRLDWSRLTKRQDPRAWRDIAGALRSSAYGSRLFTALANALYGGRPDYDVCFADTERLERRLKHDDLKWHMGIADAFVLRLPLKAHTWLLVLKQTQLIRRFLPTESEASVAPELRKYSRSEKEWLVYPPVPARHAVHHVLLHEVAHTKLGHIRSGRLGTIHMDREEAADEWATNQLQDFLSAERSLIRRKEHAAEA